MRRLLPDPAEDVDPVAAYRPPATASYLRVAMVASIDGAATRAGRVGPLTGRADQRLLHMLRALADVIFVGAGTVRAEGYGGALIPDEWQLYRKECGLDPHPRLAVLSGALDLDLDEPPFTDSPCRPLVLTTSSAPGRRLRSAARVADVRTVGERRVEIPAAVAALTECGLGHVLCEGGPSVLSQLVAAGAVDELCLTVAPTVVCGDGLRITDGVPLPTPERARLAQVLEDEQFLFLSYRPGYSTLASAPSPSG